MNLPSTALLPPVAARRFVVWSMRVLPPALAVALALALALLGAACWPIAAPGAAAREALFEIPHGTYARRMAGNMVEILPDTVHLTMVVKDVLLLRNLDDVPQVFGPVLIMPGQSFRLPFEKASSYSFACSAHASGQMRVVVADAPAPGWQRLRWRLGTLLPGRA